MRMALLNLFFLLLASVQAQATARVTGAYLKSEFESSFKEDEYRLNSDLRFSRFQDLAVFLGYYHQERTYPGGTKVEKNSYLLGGSLKFPNQKMYVEGGVVLGDTDLIGSKSVYSIMPHTTAFKNFDLGLGFDYASYSTGDISTIKPQIIYFFNDSWMVGHTSWFFNDDGSHYAWRNYLRGQAFAWSGELSIAGGEAREDIGVIDQFMSYSFGINRNFSKATVGITTERYEGHLRKGWQWGIVASWAF